MSVHMFLLTLRATNTASVRPQMGNNKLITHTHNKHNSDSNVHEPPLYLYPLISHEVYSGVMEKSQASLLVCPNHCTHVLSAADQ